MGGWVDFFFSSLRVSLPVRSGEIAVISVASYDVAKARTVVRLVFSQRSKVGWDCQEIGAGSAAPLPVRLRGGCLGVAVVGLGGGARDETVAFGDGAGVLGAG